MELSETTTTNTFFQATTGGYEMNCKSSLRNGYSSSVCGVIVRNFYSVQMLLLIHLRQKDAHQLANGYTTLKFRWKIMSENN